MGLDDSGSAWIWDMEQKVIDRKAFDLKIAEDRIDHRSKARTGTTFGCQPDVLIVHSNSPISYKLYKEHIRNQRGVKSPWQSVLFYGLSRVGIVLLWSHKPRWKEERYLRPLPFLGKRRSWRAGPDCKSVSSG